jgi:hypothetical protein
MTRKNFNYRNATVSEIVEHFKSTSAQNIYAARKAYKDDEEMSIKIEDAYFQYKVDKFKSSFVRCSPTFD